MTEHWASFMLTPAEIYHQLTEGPGAAELSYEQRETQREHIAEDDRARLILSLATLIDSGWHGEASESAYGAVKPLAGRTVENADKLDRAQDLLTRQIGSFHRASNSVVPVPDPPQMSVDEPFPFDVDHDKAVQEYQDAAQNNIAVYREYDGASHYNETNLPQEYHGNVPGGGDVAVKAGDTIKVGEPGPGTGGPRRDGPGDSGSFSSEPYPGSSGGYPDGSSSGPVGPGSGPGGSQTSPTDFRPTPRPPYSSPMPTYPAPGQSSPVSGGFVGGLPIGGYSGGGGAGEFGPRGGAGGSGAPGGGRGPAGGGPGGGGSGQGVRGPLGAGAGALAAEEAAAARRAAQAAAAAGGRPGGVGAMGAPMGAGRSKDDEDSEHQRKVLIEADAEETFGSDVLTAPQVIGDDEYEDD